MHAKTGSTPTRIDDELYEAARLASVPLSRSTAQQIAHWARLGRALEESPAAPVAAIRAVLEGKDAYDTLPDAAQAVVRAEWEAEVARRLASLDLAAEFSAAGRSWSEADADGRVVTRGTPA